MSKKRMIILCVIAVLLLMSTSLSISYGYYVISGDKTIEMKTATSTPACVGLTITSDKTFNLEGDYAVPIREEQFLNSSLETKNNFKYSFTITNDCNEEKSLSIGVVSLNGSTILVNNMKYILVESGYEPVGGAKRFTADNINSLSNDMKEYLVRKYNYSSPAVFNLEEVTIMANSSKSYDLYMWLDEGAENDTMNQSLKATVILYNPVN